ncbi:hypothetical protein [Paracoccus mutanolyticus]|uniref:hypothetical protein n=1 Tax=Paracoccus mutanolyticus TaxID=1499308 RepID=UPI0037CB6119
MVSYDMGGTTAKICLIEDFQPKTARYLRDGAIYGSGAGLLCPAGSCAVLGRGCGRAGARWAVVPRESMSGGEPSSSGTEGAT